MLAGLRHGRRVMGAEKEADYVAITEQRIADFYAGKLKIRPLGKQVHQPTGREKVAQVPEEWGQSE